MHLFDIGDRNNTRVYIHCTTTVAGLAWLEEIEGIWEKSIAFGPAF
jgi:hypothetical protein